MVSCSCDDTPIFRGTFSHKIVQPRRGFVLHPKTPRGLSVTQLTVYKLNNTIERLSETLKPQESLCIFFLSSKIMAVTL